MTKVSEVLVQWKCLQSLAVECPLQTLISRVHQFRLSCVNKRTESNKKISHSTVLFLGVDAIKVTAALESRHCFH